MKKSKYHLVCYNTDQILFEGWFISLKSCVEKAVSEGVSLDGVDLAGANLACANLDEAQMCGARLVGTNLNGANLSEAVFDGADFTGADLSYVCFAVSSLLDVNFTGASFAATDVTDAVIRGCKFSCPSVFSTLLHRAAIFSQCVYMHEGQAIKMNAVPIVIIGLAREIVYLDQSVKIGSDFVTKADLCDAGMSHLKFLYGEEVARFLFAAMREKNYAV